MFSQEGLTAAWDNLLRDGEYIDDESENVKKNEMGGLDPGPPPPATDGDDDRNSDNSIDDSDKKPNKRCGFLPLLEEWTWGEV